ncbi:MAG: PepSY-associated TM helix domain-containing protein [Flavobacterium sp.]|uniref:PepSY-associated TM helix domain-containing protein n=1 Tax=Flavobacterium sp. TaxID=239 RepID=UPI002FC58593
MIKKGILWLHKWLGLFSGLVVLIVSLTGCVYVFHDDLKVLFYPEKYYVAEQSPSNEVVKALPLSTLTAIAQKALPNNEEITRIDLYPAKNRTWVFRAVKTNEDALTYAAYFTYNKRVFVDPYTGKVQAVENSKTEFFQLVLQLHMNLLLGKKLGHTIVSVSTILFLILTVTGLVLWWPKKWKAKTLKKGIAFDFKVKWKRLNYDLHNILGFYSLLFALLLGFTGLLFSYPSLKELYSNSFNKLDRNESVKTISFDTVTQQDVTSLDNALVYTLAKHPSADMMSVRLRKDEALHDIQVRLQKDRTGSYVWYYFNKEDGQISKIKNSNQAQTGDWLAGMNYDLHVGNFGGIFTKILYFLASLICASLPVTGFIIWWNKRKKSKKTRVKVAKLL